MLTILWAVRWYGAETGQTIGEGTHPAVAIDPAGKVHVVYGQGQKILYSTSATGESFSRPQLIDSLPGLHLGASRGPQIAATSGSVVITAIDKAGDVWAYRLDRTTGHWQKRITVTDVPRTALEGFVTLTAGPDDTFNAFWLDLRGNKRNKIAGAHSTNGGRTWSANRIIYQSPDGTVCECCQLTAVSRGDQVVLMFRNFLKGSRDMYLISSADGGQTFGRAVRLGVGTWLLNACPMDGGGLFINPQGAIWTVWRRRDTLFTARPGEAETKIAVGKNPKIVSTLNGTYVL
ncbi:sialidase family protein [Spirosoma taeanense]|uniref:sialidase family protein n=1 Tax=Spirosoma taeanense TaxID=2735870 RepID=UPI001F039DD6|nr:sialidase family protein [Spirosoma taeanense]